MSTKANELRAVAGDDAQQDPVRVLVVQEDERPAVRQRDSEMVMTFPHLLVKELIAVVALSIVLVAASLLFDAPLEELANPDKTPNPAKAPWYFLGLQELLHYYSPLVSGVVLPGLVVGALIVVPYFDINLQRESLYKQHARAVVLGVSAAALAICALFYFTAAHPVWSLIGTTLFIAVGMLLPAFVRSQGRFMSWLASRSISFWIFSWFLIASVVLTVIGTFFRGPGWAFTLPWRDGIY